MEDFVNFEISKKLKEKGFDEACYNYYEPLKHCLSELKTQFTNKEGEYYGIITAPTISQVLKWLRKEKKIHIIVEIADSGWYYTLYPNIRWENGKLKSDKYIMSFKPKVSYEQSALAGIEYVINNWI